MGVVTEITWFIWYNIFPAFFRLSFGTPGGRDFSVSLIKGVISISKKIDSVVSALENKVDDIEEKVDDNPDTLTDDEINLLLEQTPDSWSGRRDREVMIFMLHTGCRVSEVVGLRWGQVDFEDRRIDISPSKFWGERRLVVSKEYASRLKAWRDVARGDKWVFSNARGGDLSARYVREFLDTYSLRAGLDDARVNPHLFRHTFAERFFLETENLQKLQLVLGHKDIKTTAEFYLHVLSDEQRTRVTTTIDIDLAHFEKRLPNMTMSPGNNPPSD